MIETTRANLAYRVDDSWFVPPLEDGGLPGVGSAVALAEGEVSERSIAATDLPSCDALALISAVRGWREARLI